MRTKKESHKTPGQTEKNTSTTSQSQQQGGRYLQQMQRRSSNANKYSSRQQRSFHTPSFHRRIP